MADTKLAKYRSMRDFSQTDEPASGGERADGNSYVIQKHAASHLHYDFRLELDGVLLSWSVPKGPSLAPKDRRLAVRTEDHPVSYGAFEGTIPQGQYGGGTVAVWDRGTWKPDGDPRAMMRKGRLKFTLAGEKLRGRWHLIKTEPRGKQESWLLFKGRDDEADDDTDIVTTKPDSVASGRSIEQIAAGRRAKRAAKPAPRKRATAKVAPTALDKLDLGFRLTSTDRVIYPDQGTTKGELFAYLVAVAERMLPHVVHRPLSIVRCPGGQGK
jgi:bifunctional non-homologous end joining protein LigD